MSFLTKGLEYEKHMLHLTKVTYLAKCQVEDLVKMDKRPSKSPWFNQIDHIEWISFSQFDHLDLTFSQIDRYDLTLSQMSHTHLMT